MDKEHLKLNSFSKLSHVIWIYNSEAEYTYKLQKSFIPLKLEKTYVADGWLGIMIGTKLYFDFSKDGRFESTMANLIRELRIKQGAVSNEADVTDHAITPGGKNAQCQAHTARFLLSDTSLFLSFGAHHLNFYRSKLPIFIGLKVGAYDHIFTRNFRLQYKKSNHMSWV